MPGLLYDTGTHNRLTLFVLSFIRLVGTVYFKKHIAYDSLPPPEQCGWLNCANL